jgi:hypothetical protein
MTRLRNPANKRNARGQAGISRGIGKSSSTPIIAISGMLGNRGKR